MSRQSRLNAFMKRIPQAAERSEVMPFNCQTCCTYGKGRAFCYPCIQKILKEHRERRQAHG